MICLYGTKPYDDAPTIDQGWTDPGSPATNGTTGAGVDVGSMQARFFWKRHTGTESDPTITNTTNNVSGAAIYLIKPTSGVTLLDPVGSGGGDSSSGTSFSFTAGSAFNVAVGDLFLSLVVLPTNAVGPSSGPALSASGATINYGSWLHSESTTSGGDMVYWTDYFTCTAGESNSAMSYSLTLNGSATGTGYIVRLRESLPKSYPAYRPNRRAQHLLSR